MKCPDCKHSETKVMESRELFDSDVIRRRRECLHCNERFTTYERIEVPILSVLKKDGRREQFSRQKLANGIFRACEKRSMEQNRLEEVITKIEKRLRAKGEQEITSKNIGETVLEELHILDDISYIRFASVYQSFDDIKSFQAILNNLSDKKKEV